MGIGQPVLAPEGANEGRPAGRKATTRRVIQAVVGPRRLVTMDRRDPVEVAAEGQAELRPGEDVGRARPVGTVVGPGVAPGGLVPHQGLRVGQGTWPSASLVAPTAGIIRPEAVVPLTIPVLPATARPKLQATRLVVAVDRRTRHVGQCPQTPKGRAIDVRDLTATPRTVRANPRHGPIDVLRKAEDPTRQHTGLPT